MNEHVQQHSDIIEHLQSKIQALTDENRLLKQRMVEVGISYADIVAGSDETASERYDPDQGARIRIFDATDKVASDFFMMFCRGRKDVYDLRYTNPKTRKNGYYTQCFNLGIETVIYRKRIVFGVRTVNLGRTSRLRCLL